MPRLYSGLRSRILFFTPECKFWLCVFSSLLSSFEVNFGCQNSVCEKPERNAFGRDFSNPKINLLRVEQRTTRDKECPEYETLGFLIRLWRAAACLNRGKQVRAEGGKHVTCPARCDVMRSAKTDMEDVVFLNLEENCSVSASSKRKFLLLRWLSQGLEFCTNWVDCQVNRCWCWRLGCSWTKAEESANFPFNRFVFKLWFHLHQLNCEFHAWFCMQSVPRLPVFSWAFGIVANGVWYSETSWVRSSQKFQLDNSFDPNGCHLCTADQNLVPNWSGFAFGMTGAESERSGNKVDGKCQHCCRYVATLSRGRCSILVGALHALCGRGSLRCPKLRLRTLAVFVSVRVMSCRENGPLFGLNIYSRRKNGPGMPKCTNVLTRNELWNLFTEWCRASRDKCWAKSFVYWCSR